MYQQRINKLRQILQEKSFDAFLVSNYYNILYLIGFKTLTENEREAFVLITQHKTYLITDERYINKNSKFKIPSSTAKRGEQNSELNLEFINQNNKLIQILERIIPSNKIKKLAVEAEDIKLFEYLNLKEKLKVEIVPIDRLIVHLRMIKDNQEIRNIKEACRIGDQCLREIIKIIKVGQTEKEIAWKIESWIREKGFDIAFDPIVAADKNSAIPHYNTKDGIGRVRRGSIILIDFGVKYKDYCSDITRMIFIGQPKQEQANIYNNLLTAQQSTINYLTKIKNLKEVDQYSRKLLTYSHSTGHGIGLEVHEYPKVSKQSQDVIKPNQVFTIEPGIYFEEKWGMRVEDTVFISKDLQPYVLTNFPKSPLIL